MRTYYAKSRASGKCRQCGKAITKGQPAWWSQAQGWQCSECNTSAPPAGDEPKKSKPLKAKATATHTTVKCKGELPNAKLTRTGDRLEIEFERFSDAVEAATAQGSGYASNIELVDQHIRVSGGGPFFNNHTTGEMINLVKTGSAKMTKLVDEMREQIASEISLPTASRRRLKRGRDFGDEIQADRFLDRIPEMWERMETDQVPAKRVTIAISLAVSALQSQEHLGYRAAAAIALADALTELGVSVEIRAMKCAGNNPSDRISQYVTTIIVKPSDQPMSIPDLAIACCDIGVARLGTIFASSRYLPGKLKTTLGTPIMIPAEHRVADFIADRDIDNQEKAIEWARTAINQFEIQ